MNRYGDTAPIMASMSGIFMWVMILLIILVGGSMAYQYMYPSKSATLMGTGSNLGSGARSTYYSTAPQQLY